MTITQRAVVSSLIVVLAFGGFAFACPQWTAEFGLDVWNYSDYEEALRQNEQEMVQLNELGQRIRQRLSLKILITHDLVSKRINLAQATDQFLELNKIHPETVTDTCRQHPAASHEESVAIQVISFARAELESNPARCQEVVCDLEQQLQEMRDGNAED